MISFDQILLSSIAGSALTLLVSSSITRWKELNHLKKIKKVLQEFITGIILKYLELNLKNYKDLLQELENNEPIIKQRIITESPMLNKGIFDFFEKKDLLKLFSYCKKNSVVELYHNFHEIDHLQNNSILKLLDKYSSRIVKHYNTHKIGDETMDEHFDHCSNYFYYNEDFIIELKMFIEHTSNLIVSFNQFNDELKTINIFSGDVEDD